jgi:hypothetical protein
MKRISKAFCVLFLTTIPAALSAQEKSLSYDKSLDASEKNLQEEGIWAPDEIDRAATLPEANEKGLGDLDEPSIHEYRIKTTKGELILSQKWDAACSEQLCETRAILVSPTGKRITLTTDMMPQFALEKSGDTFKSLNAQQVFLSPDEKNLEFHTESGIYEVPLY